MCAMSANCMVDKDLLCVKKSIKLLVLVVDK